MAKILFISVFDINTEGIRILSSILKKKGHSTYVIFFKRLKRGPVLNPETDWIGIGENGVPFQHAGGSRVSEREKNILLSTVKSIKPDLIGFTVTSPIAPLTKAISKEIRKVVAVPIIWGGPHVTMWTRDCIKYCDFVCIGEADSIILEIAKRIDNGEKFAGIQGLVATNADMSDIHPVELTSDLDSLPFKDISPTGKFLIENDKLIEGFADISYSGDYHMISSRGCPYRCSYCGEDVFKSIYSGYSFLRRKSPECVVSEIKHAREMIEFKCVHFEDETFSYNLNWLEKFSELYKKEIGLPFECYIFPKKGVEKHIQLLKSVGLRATVLSLQSGSKYINQKIFKRPFERNLFLDCANFLHANEIKFSTDVITYNPFETESDLNDTLNVLIDLPKPFELDVNKLYIFKGTKMEQLKNTSSSEPLPDRTINLYARLFWLAKYNKTLPKTFFSLIKNPLIRRFPFLINPSLLNMPFKFFNLINSNINFFR